jgi:hypothetical protein
VNLNYPNNKKRLNRKRKRNHHKLPLNRKNQRLRNKNSKKWKKDNPDLSNQVPKNNQQKSQLKRRHQLENKSKNLSLNLLLSLPRELLLLKEYRKLLQNQNLRKKRRNKRFLLKHFLK